MKKADIGVIGVGAMGENLVLNMEQHDFTVAIFNQPPEKVDAFISLKASNKNIIGTHSIKELVEVLSSPRKCMLMLPAGNIVDKVITELIPYLDDGDIIIDGGNSHFLDTTRRLEKLKEEKLLYLGVGISGGIEGALKGPSIMCGGDKEAWEETGAIFQRIAAKLDDGTPCCDYLGPNGVGHYIKMIHNGIEYAIMQLICEVYSLMKNILSLNTEEIHRIFEEWNKGKLNSYLIEITAKIFTKKDKITHQPLIDVILDVANEKGTGKWATYSALNLGVPIPSISEAIFVRFLSTFKEEREVASKILPYSKNKYKGDKEEFISAIEKALYAAEICSYTQGFALIKRASKEYGWQLNLGKIALIWSNGCIIRAQLLEKIKEAFTQNPNLPNLLLNPYFRKVMKEYQPFWRQVVSTAISLGIAVFAFSSALAYFDGYRCEKLPTNLLQAQRDYFGAHQYERVDHPRGEFFHTYWAE